MSQTPKEDTSPATKADIAAIIETMDRRFATMERQLDDRFDAVDRRFDAVDQQFDDLPACFGDEGAKIRLHADRVGRETRRHVDATDASLTNFIRRIFDFKTLVFGEKYREHDRRIRALERIEATVA